MLDGEWYTCIDDELERMRMAAREAVHQHNVSPPHERGQIGQKLHTLLGKPDAFIEAPFHCAYGRHIKIGPGVYVNAGCVILDSAEVCIGERTQIGPNVQIYCAEHHHDPTLRTEGGLEIARAVSIGQRVWIGGGAIILAGVTIGDGAIVGAGAVVTRDVKPAQTVAGNPARPL